MYNLVANIISRVGDSDLMNLKRKGFISKGEYSQLREYIRLELKSSLKDFGVIRNEYSLAILRIYISDGYIGSYIIYHGMLLKWMAEKSYENFDRQNLFELGINGLVGYRVKDIHLDNNSSNMKDYYLIAECLIEKFYYLLNSIVNNSCMDIIYEHKLFLQFTEINEKYSMRKRLLCYNRSIESGYKSTMLFIFLYILRDGKDNFNKFKEMLASFTAVIQIIDDLEDIEDDVQNHHYSYVFNAIFSKELVDKPLKYQVGLALEKENLNILKNECYNLIMHGEAIATELNEVLFQKLFKNLRIRSELHFDKMYKKVAVINK